MWNKLIGWWESKTRRKSMKDSQSIHASVLRDRTSKAEIQVMSILAVLVIVPLAALAYYFFAGGPRGEATYADGIRLVSPGHYKEAIVKLTRAIDELPKDDPKLYMAYLLRGMSYRYEGDRAKGREDLNKAIELRADCARCFVERAGLLRELKEYALALDDLDRAQTLDKQAEIYVERGSIYEAQNQPQKAIDEYTKAIGMREEWPYLYRARARLRKQIGDLEGYEADKARVVSSGIVW
ncbi:MAG: hypothetical protein ABI823_05615 [Bryobacteraceae bacterium]